MSEGQSGGRGKAPAARQTERLSAAIDRALCNLAELASRALPATMCAVAWRIGVEQGAVCAPGGAAARGIPMVQALASAPEPASVAENFPETSSRVFDPSRMAAIAAAAAGSFGGAYREREVAVFVALAPAPEASEPEIRALLELVGTAALSRASAVHSAASRDFWRERATREHAVRAAQKRDTDESSATVARLERLAARERLRALGEAVAAASGSERWLVALGGGAAFEIEAASAPLQTDLPVACSAEFAEAIRQARTAVRRGGSEPRPVGAENRILGPDWTALPFGGGAVAVAGAPGPDALERAAAIVGAAAPLVRAWRAERGLEEFRAVVQRMALRMFAAIDDERARIARDLHDDQGQLLAAARLALKGKPEKARVIFEQLERELRTRTRELRPATLGKLSLATALESEAARAREAGLTASVSIDAGVESSPPHVQQLCFQVAREALTNVMRHSGASSVELAVQRADATLRLIVADDGRGIRPAPQAHSSMGLAGMTERLELMGGKLRVKSTESGTTLVAEIPEPL